MHFGVLGPLEVRGQDGPLSLGGPKQRIVLAHLVLSANRVVSAEHLIDALWGQDLPDDPRSTLQVYVSRLRSVLGSDGIQARAPGYVLRAERDEVDLLRFEDLLADARGNRHDARTTDRILTEALGLWRGPAFADLADEPSLSGEIARIEELRLQAMEERLDAELELGHHSEVVAELATLTRTYPLRERLWGELMLALYRLGRQGEAIEAFERARTVLGDELGIDPSRDLQALHQRILRQDPDLDLKGEPLRGYRLLEQIGEGAFGVVYRATQPQIGREVAIKAVPPELANHPDFVRRFEREAQIVAKLEHPHIVPLYDYWREPDAAYLVMRFLRGGSVEELLRSGPLEPQRAASILDQVAAALSAAHRQGVVHRDVKPGNVLLDDEGNAYLTDFGVALDAGSPERSSGTMIRGTPGYLSPEQVRLDPSSPQSDVYALGIVAYEMLTGALPFPDDTSIQAVLDHHLRDPVPPVREARPDLPAALDLAIARATAKDATERFSDALELAAAFRAALEGTPIVAQPVGEIRNPYKGLRAFLEADAADFFGRETVTRRLLRRLEEAEPASRFLAVVGPSGSGKSSVVRAGLVPALRRGALAGSERWYVIDLLPGPHPFRELESALLGLAVEPPPSLLDTLEGDTRGLLLTAERILPDPDAELVIVLDQLEEVFTLVADEEERLHVLESLRTATQEPGSRVRVVATLRADFFDQPLSVRGFGDLLAERTEAITPMSPEELERAIVAPAERAGLAVEPRLLAASIADVVDQPGGLPLLQFTLTELAERRDDGALTLAGYRRIGGVSGALARRAEQIFEALDQAGREGCRQLFLRLVTLGEGSEDTRRRVRRSELAPLAEPLVMEGVLEAFGRHRLLSFDRDPETREPTIEIGHEALLGAWDRLRDWIDEAREDIRTQRRLAFSVADWEASERDASFLLRGARLDQVRAWIETTTLALSESDREYVRQSVTVQRTTQERERALARRLVRRLRSLVAVGVTAALVATTLTVIALDQRGRARDQARIARDAATAQLAQRLGAQALVEDDLDLSLLLARQSVAIDDSPQTRSYLLSTLLSAEAVAGVMHGRWSDYLRAIALSPDGTTLAVGDAEAGLLFFDTRTYERIGEIRVRHGVESVAYSPDGQTVAYGGEGVLRLIDARTWERLADAHVTETDTGVNRISFTPDGSRLVVVIQSRTEAESDRISVRDADTLAATGHALTPEGFQGAYVGFTWQAPGFALTPDGRSAVIASNEDELVWLDLSSGTPTERAEIGSGRHPLALSRDGRTAAVGVDAGIQLLDVRSGDVGEVLDAPGGSPSWLLFSPDGETLVSTSLDGTVTLWDVRSARLRETLRGHSGSVMQPVYSRDGQTLYTASHDGTAIAWDIGGDRGLERRFTFTHDPVPDPDYSGHPGVFSPDGRVIAVGLQGRGIGLWATKDLTRAGPPLLETGHEVKTLAFSPDGRTLAASALGVTITLWDVDSRSRLRHESLDSVFGDTAFTPDGRTLAVTTGSGVRLVDVANWAGTREIRSEVGESGSGFVTPTFSADGSKIAAGRALEGGAEVWDVATGTSIVAVEASHVEEPNDGAALSPDGRTLAVGGWLSAPIRIVEVPTGELVRQFDPGGGGAFAFDFSPDGRVLAVGGWEPVASLWDVAAGAQIGPTFSAGNGRAMVDLSPDGHQLLLTHADGHGAIYDVDPESWARRACALANRTLTQEEWEEFLPGRPYEPACR